ncbi:MAG: sterol desaturase family protein [Alphaproteobacteria bacterium]
MENGADIGIALKTAIVASWFAALFVAERLSPADPRAARRALREGRWRRLGRNGSLWLINTGLSLLVILPLTQVAVAAHLDWRPLWWRGWAGVALDVLLLDFLIYWWHRANHEMPFLWRFHEVHHLDATLDTTTAVRFHFGEVMLSALARAAVVVPLAFPMASVLAFESSVLMAALFHHSNLRLPPGFERALSRVVITPSIHWVHHHAVRTDTDSNYGTVFSFWDPLFGSRSRTPRASGMAIGVEGKGEEPLLSLIAHPARPAT